MKTLLFVLLFVAAMWSLCAQTSTEWLWAGGTGGEANDYACSVSMTLGSLSQSIKYVAGGFGDTVDFGSTSLTSFGEGDGFVAKMTGNGTWNWAVKMGGTGADCCYDVAADGGFCYITGTYRGTAHFGTTTLFSDGSPDIFIAKLDSSGNWLWAKRAGGTYDDAGCSICIDPDGNICVTGYYTYNAMFGETQLELSNSADTFVAKLDAEGNWLWASQLNVASATVWSWHDVAVDAASNVFVSGCASSSVFAGKLDSAGNWLWTRYSTGDIASANGIAVDGSGNAILTGLCGNNGFGAHNVTTHGGYDIFVAKLDGAGNWLWAINGGGTGTDIGYDVTLDGNGDACITGAYMSTSTFGSLTLTTSALRDILAAKVDKNGYWLWVASAGGGGEDYGYGISLRTTVNGIQYLWIVGTFVHTATFGDYTLTGDNSNEIFIARLDSPNTASIPKAPVVTINRYSIGALLDWEPITEDTWGRPITVDYYNVYYSTDPFGTFTYLDDTTYSQYLCPTATIPKRFFLVKAVGE